MGQILATPQSGDRLIFGLFQAGQVGMLDTTDRANLKQLSVVSFGKDAGPHNLVLSSDDKRLVVIGLLPQRGRAGIIHFEGDHKVHVLKVTHDTLTEDTRFKLDFNTAFRHGPGASPRDRDEVDVHQCTKPGILSSGGRMAAPARRWLFGLGIAAAGLRRIRRRARFASARGAARRGHAGKCSTTSIRCIRPTARRNPEKRRIAAWISSRCTPAAGRRQPPAMSPGSIRLTPDQEQAVRLETETVQTCAAAHTVCTPRAAWRRTKP